MFVFLVPHIATVRTPAYRFASTSVVSAIRSNNCGGPSTVACVPQFRIHRSISSRLFSLVWNIRKPCPP
jgi:hypothetical protein